MSAERRRQYWDESATRESLLINFFIVRMRYERVFVILKSFLLLFFFREREREVVGVVGVEGEIRERSI